MRCRLLTISLLLLVCRHGALSAGASSRLLIDYPEPVNHKLQIKMAPHLGFEMCFAIDLQVPGPNGPDGPKTRLESSTKKFKPPFFIYD